MDYVGIDLGKLASAVCIEEEDGTVTLERRIKTTRECLAESRPPDIPPMRSR